MTRINQSIFPAGPFSAVTPYAGGTGRERFEPEPTYSEPRDGFEIGPVQEAPLESSAPSFPPTGALLEGASRSGLQAATRAFPQVVHLLVNPEEQWGENLSKEVGLPLISLRNGQVEELHHELQKPEYANGFILEGFPSDAESAQKLDSMLSQVAPQDRRVLGWELTDDSHQEVLDHYMDQDLLWMVPESSDPTSTLEASRNVMSCLVGLPALQ